MRDEPRLETTAPQIIAAAENGPSSNAHVVVVTPINMNVDQVGLGWRELGSGVPGAWLWCPPVPPLGEHLGDTVTNRATGAAVDHDVRRDDDVTGQHRVDLRVLLVTDDDKGARRVVELLDDVAEQIVVLRAGSMAEAAELAPGLPCAVIDLTLPVASDGVSVAALNALWERAPDLAVIVLTGFDDRDRGVEAVAAGAHEHLLKDELDGPRLAEAIHAAIERRRSEIVVEQLTFAAHQQYDNDRLARGLLPMLRFSSTDVEAATCYRPGTTAVLGGDFFDAIALPDGTVRAVIGDVCGHGPTEAAVGVALRIAWRTMTMAGHAPNEVIASVEEILRVERDDDVYATLCDVTISDGLRALEVRRHGHPPPLLHDGARWRWLQEDEGAPPIGLWEHTPAPIERYALSPVWSILLVTDGIYDGRGPSGRLGMDDLAGLLDRLSAQGLSGNDLLSAVADAAAGSPDGGLDDDLALLCLSRSR